MTEKNLDFDSVIERHNTLSLKYDFTKERGVPEDVLPLWVADMDFKSSSAIIEVLKERAEHGIFGYTETNSQYFDALYDWFKNKHNFIIQEDWIIKTPGVVMALALAVKAYTKVGDAVLIQQPVYYPFREVIVDNERKVISNDLVLQEDGKYHIDFEDFERKIVRNKVKLFILCSPHNPIGRVWTVDELTRLGDICIKHNVLVVSDEIHQDFVFEGNKHTVFSTIKPEFENNCIICTSPGKTFNLAGLQISNIFIPNKELRQSFKKQLDAVGYSQANTFGIEGCIAAYKYGQTWLDAVLKYIQSNVEFVKEYVTNNIPKVKVIDPEGTYLVWLDFKEYHLCYSEQQDLILNKAKLWLDSGLCFGDSGLGYERINVACPRSILEEALGRIAKAVKEL